jgi:hypothetical protein
MNKKIKICLVIVGVLLVGVYFGCVLNLQRTEAGAINKVATDLVGTRIGSTTDPVSFPTKNAASTTYPFYVGGKKIGVISLGVVAASTSANVQVSILGSNDYGCNTATTSTILNVLTRGEVQWFDAASHLKNSAVTSSFANGITTLVWTNPSVNTIRELILDDLALECLALNISASSTSLWSQYRLQD